MISLLQCAILALVLAPNQTKTSELNPSNSKIEFRAKHFGVLNVDGTFSKFKGTFTLEDNVVKDASMEIEVNSVSTGNENRDKSLKTDTFLYPEAYPKIKFKSNETTNSEVINGLLTIKNSSKIIAIPYTTNTKNDQLIVTAKYVLKRSDFDLEFGTMDDLVSNEIRINIELRLDL